MKWIAALKLWNAEHNPTKWCVPRKGSPEHAMVRRIMAEDGAARDTLREEEEKMARAAPARRAAPVVVEEIDYDALFKEARTKEIGTGLKKEKVKAFLKKLLERRKAARVVVSKAAKVSVKTGAIGAGGGDVTTSSSSSTSSASSSSSNLSERNIVEHMKAYESSRKQDKTRYFEEFNRNYERAEQGKNLKEYFAELKLMRKSRLNKQIERIKQAGIPKGETKKVTLGRSEFIKALEKATKTDYGYDDIGISFIVPGRKTRAGAAAVSPIFFIENNLLRDSPSTRYTVYFAINHLVVEKV